MNKWDKRFLDMAKLVSTWSKDPSTKVGSVIVSPTRRVISLGYNGFPQTMPDKQEWYDNRDEKYSRVIHAEMNALMFSDLDLKDCTVYTYPVAPCDRCAVMLIQAGIKRFVFPRLPASMKERWENTIDKSKHIMIECGKYIDEVDYE